MYTAKDLKVNDGIGSGRIVWVTNFIDKANYPVYLFVCILPDGTYDISLSDRNPVMRNLLPNQPIYKTLPLAVKAIMEYAKKTSKLKHHV